jgi:anti-sigma regulatory factor (Ser/Thr protein kinase)
MEVNPVRVPPDVRHESAVVPVTEPSQVGDARRAAAAIAARLGFGTTPAGRLAIVVTEAAGNLVKHAGGGQLVWRQVGTPARPGVEMVALDRGPGIGEVARALEDGFSTTGTPGTGLGAIRRLSDDFDLYSGHGRGTAVLSRVYAHPPAPDTTPLRSGAVCVPKPHEEVSGDAWAVDDRPAGARVLVVDGLGHGPDAHRAARAALAAAAPDRGGPAETVEACHLALRSTRGAALAVAEIDLAAGRVRFAGVGNVTGAVFGGTRRQNMVSMNGTAGQGAARVRAFDYAWEPRATLVMASDGLATRWSLDDYPGLAARDPALIAGVLYRDHTRGRDDVTVVAVREREGREAGP